jgi:hypothetical protein
MTGKLPDPRALAKFLRTIAASPVKVTSCSVGGTTWTFDGPASSKMYQAAPDRPEQSRPGPEEEREAWDMVGDSVLPGMLGEAN